MRVCVVGAGYVGLVTGALLADSGHQVGVVEADPSRLQTLQNGGVPFFEPELVELLRRAGSAGRLQFTGRLAEAAAQAAVTIVAVGTPARPDGLADLGALLGVARQLAGLKDRGQLLVVKSTVPVGTADLLQDFLDGLAGPRAWRVASNPEFLRQGSAIADTLQADRLVFGVADDLSARQLAELYSPWQRPMLLVTRRSAEMIKYAANAFLATKISFINEIANLCDLLGADVTMVRRGLAMDQRIGGAFLGAGIGFGGSCLPKDLAALSAQAQAGGYRPDLLDSVRRVNERQLRRQDRRSA